MEFEARKKVQIHLNITPLIDIVFLLLIFFMLTANFIMQPGIEVNLPDAENAAVHESDRVIVTITGDGNIFVNEKMTDLNLLKAELDRAVESSGNATVILKADKDIKFGPAVEVIDAVKSSSADGIIISTDAGKHR